jgi:hypothetical protein
MSFNALDIYLKEKKNFIAARGVSGASSIGKAIPATTWRDVYKFGAAFLAKCSNKGVLKCAMKHEINPFFRTNELENKCGYLLAVETWSFKKAQSDFADEQPFARAWREWGAAGPAFFVAKSEMNEVYPWNKEFWETANRFAIARNAAGMVENDWSMAIDAIYESVKDLPENVAGGVGRLADALGITALLKKIALYGGIGLGIYIFGPRLLQSLTRKKGK